MLRDLSKYGVEADVVRMAQHPRHQLVRIAGGQSAAFMAGLHASLVIAAGVLLAAAIAVLLGTPTNSSGIIRSDS